MAEINSVKFGLALASVAGLAYVVCAILIAIAPESTVNLFGSLFHGIDINKIASDSISLGRTVLGFIEIIVLGYIAGWLFGKIYNKLK